jgi:hypothetical protein
MKPKDKKRLEWTALLVGGAAVAAVGAYFIYEHETANPVTLAPGTITGTVPSNGTSTFELPSGAQSWTTAAQTSTAGTTTLQVPSSASSGLKTATPHGSSFAFTWVDSTGSTQATTVTFA